MVSSVFNDKCTPMACDVIFTFDIKYKCSPIRRCNLFTNNPLRDNIIQCGYTSTKEWLCCAVCRIEILSVKPQRQDVSGKTAVADSNAAQAQLR
jgi:hypothetical protein